MKTLVKLSRNGHATQITITRRLMDFMRWRAGDYVTVELTERGTLEVRLATVVDLRADAPQPAPAPALLEDGR